MLYFVTGTTASGKSLLAHKLAKKRSMKIISMDSMAVYKGLNVLSDTPSILMQNEVKYYGIDIVNPSTNFSVFNYIEYLINQKINKLSLKENFLVVGGTGLYFNSLVDNYKFRSVNEKYRKNLETLTLEELQDIFININIQDETIDQSNKRRLIRAIESANKDNINETYTFSMPDDIVGIFWDNPSVETNITKRTEIMLQKGLIDEVLKIKNPNRTIKQAIGYKEITGNMDENIIKDEINRKTNKLVKKQKTWFKKIPKLKYMNTSNPKDIEIEIEAIIDG